MATVVIDQEMYIDLPRPDDEEGFYEERKEVARVRVKDSARGPGEMIGWLQYQADEEEMNQLEGYRLPCCEEEYLPDLGGWLAERSGVSRIYWTNMVVQEDVWKAVIARFL